jgi:quinoprotein glucose dehydrogenase
LQEDERLGHDYEYNAMLGTPFAMRRRILTGPSGLPCSTPPWGTLVAVDLAEGDIAWQVPLGSATALVAADVASQVESGWGSPNLGGPVVTAGGIVFIGASLDRTLHAYDIETGRELWSANLPGSARATPMSYQVDSGEQFVVVAVGGGEEFGVGDYLLAFHLPRSLR